MHLSYFISFKKIAFQNLSRKLIYVVEYFKLNYEWKYVSVCNIKCAFLVIYYNKLPNKLNSRMWMKKNNFKYIPKFTDKLKLIIIVNMVLKIYQIIWGYNLHPWGGSWLLKLDLQGSD